MWLNAALVAHPLACRRSAAISGYAAEDRQVYSSIKDLWNPSSIRLQTYFGEQWEPLWTRGHS